MNDRPKGGVYLDAALAVIGEQIDERIDALSRRRRIRTRTAVAALALVTLASASAAAYALTANPTQPPAAVTSGTPTIAGELRCINAPDPQQAAYFTASYRLAVNEQVDAVAVCDRAHDAIAASPLQYEQITPAQAVAAATTLIGGATDSVTVERASFGAVTSAGAWHGVCHAGATQLVLTSPTRLPSSAWSARCANVGMTGGEQ